MKYVKNDKNKNDSYITIITFSCNTVWRMYLPETHSSFVRNVSPTLKSQSSLLFNSCLHLYSLTTLLLVLQELLLTYLSFVTHNNCGQTKPKCVFSDPITNNQIKMYLGRCDPILAQFQKTHVKYKCKESMMILVSLQC